MIINKLVKRKNNGECIKLFCEEMGIAYIKLAQILAMQNYGNLFTETDRKSLSSICDFVKPIPFSNIKNLLENEYGQLDKIFKEIDEKPIGAASISQVHKGILLNGDIVAIKIKRKDITEGLENDINKMKELIKKIII